MIACSGMALVWPEGSHNDLTPKAEGYSGCESSIPRFYNYRQPLPIYLWAPRLNLVS